MSSDTNIINLTHAPAIRENSLILASCQPAISEAILKSLQQLLQEEPSWQLGPTGLGRGSA